MRRLVVVLAIYLIGAHGALAQPPDLVVELRDLAGAPIPNASVTVFDQAGRRPLAHAISDSAGRAAFSGLGEEVVRVVCAGVLVDGTRLFLPGDDASGVLVLLAPSDNRLLLVAEADGLLRPAPELVSALDEGFVATPELGLVPTARFPKLETSAPPQVLRVPSVSGVRDQDYDVPGGADTAGVRPFWRILLLIGVLTLGLVVVLLQWRWRQG